ncbi:MULTISPECIES: serine/threonine-protein kinase [Cyanophyceae]|uniref:serine/threonine protein kinase n=1 Tax=Cyanophyceae TaxID=3028117 RepID=UPI0016820AC1|nr:MULTISPECIES: serine/threonine-protein kinase [Cyanophyceae]MBD1918247.1 protein kinase [Phormidium sp. FACHB-77]MBD2031291.1 protein kinase [Phormidium sp. FACHB-322]MBD2052358.1 protein kinase [Leptolyngbya sp. FACHB-60]
MGALTGKSLQQGKYVVEQELGRGGFGITYKAKNTVLAQAVVLKTINDALRQEPQFEEHQRHFQDEARRLARCFHPNIVRVTDFFVEDGLPHIAMDYVPGQTLDKLVQSGRPLPETTALYYIRQVSEAVEAIHQAGLLHRDIKPQNLILRPDSQQVMLIDFGIAREFTPGVTQTHTHLVSEGYAPIEQYLPQARRSPATDVYGLAATLYTLLTGQVPTTALLRSRAPLQSPHELQPSVSPDVSAAVMQGMAVEPDERPQHISDWLALLPLASHSAQASSAPSSQRPTVVVAPQYRPTTPATPRHATVPVEQWVSSPGVQEVSPLSQPSRRRVSSAWWLPAAVALSVFLPLLLGYSWWRSQTTATPSPSPSPETVTTPSTVIEPTLTEEPSPQPTNEAQEEALPTPAAPEVVTPPAEPPPAEAPPAEPPLAETPVVPDQAIEVPQDQVQTGTENSEEARRAQEQAREEARRQEELAREEVRRQEEQAREEEKRNEERERGERE